MQDLTVSPPLVWALVVAVAAALIVWSRAADRMRRGLPVVAYQPRRPVPWQAVDLLIVLLIHMAGLALMLYLAEVWLGPEAIRPLPIQDADRAGAAHVVARLMEQGSLRMLLVCGLTAAVAAPIIEEFLFRVLLQGWFESVEHRSRRNLPTLARWAPRGAMPIVFSSLLFARMHFRVDTPEMDVRFLVFAMIGNALVGLLTVALAVVLLRYRTGAVAVDLGFSHRHFLPDVGLGLSVFAAIAVPIYLMQVALSLLLPSYVAADPITLFFFALVLGILYYRTHRIVPSIVVHMALNASSLAMAWMLMGK